jgi:signal transduction histidine kinase
MTMGREFRQPCVKTFSVPSSGSMSPAIRMRPGPGLGLSIARDIARAHGGDITLEDSPLGGLRAIVAIPV